MTLPHAGGKGHTMKIFKFPLKVVDLQTVLIPERGKILSVGTQREVVCLWALVNPDASCKNEVRVRIVGTGNPIQDDALDGMAFIGTTQMARGDLIWHVYADQWAVTQIKVVPR